MALRKQRHLCTSWLIRAVLKLSAIAPPRRPHGSHSSLIATSGIPSRHVSCLSRHTAASSLLKRQVIKITTCLPESFHRSSNTSAHALHPVTPARVKRAHNIAVSSAAATSDTSTTLPPSVLSVTSGGGLPSLPGSSHILWVRPPPNGQPPKVAIPATSETTATAAPTPAAAGANHSRIAQSTGHRMSAAPAEQNMSAIASRVDSGDRLHAVVARLQKLASPGYHRPVSNKHAAVLVPLFEDPDGVVRVLLTQRSTKLSSHAGEVSLPGGKRDPGDADDAATALREAHEELGLPPTCVSVVAQLPPLLSKHYLSVVPIIGCIPPAFQPQPNPDEVMAVFTMPLAAFLGCTPDVIISTGPRDISGAAAASAPDGNRRPGADRSASAAPASAPSTLLHASDASTPALAVGKRTSQQQAQQQQQQQQQSAVLETDAGVNALPGRVLPSFPADWSAGGTPLTVPAQSTDTPPTTHSAADRGDAASPPVLASSTPPRSESPGGDSVHDSTQVLALAASGGTGAQGRAAAHDDASVAAAPAVRPASVVSHTSSDIEWQSMRYRIHSFVYEGFNVWGLTAAILIDVARAAFGREPTFVQHTPRGHDYTKIYYDGQKLAFHTSNGPDV